MSSLLKRLSITYKFAIFLVLIGVLPLLTAGLVAYQTAKDSQVDGALREQEHILEGYRDNLVLVQEQVESLIANILSVETITNELLRPRKDVTTYEQLSTEVQVGYILNGYLNIKGLVSIHVIGEQGAHFQVGDTLEKQTKETVSDQIKLDSRRSRSLVHWVGVTENINAKSNQDYVLAAAQTLYFTDRTSFERKPIGTLIVNYSTSYLSRLFEEADDSARFYLIDQNNRYIFHPDPARIGQSVGDHRQGVLRATERHVLVDTPGGGVYQTYQPIERSNWMLLSEVPQSTLLAQVDLIRNTTLAVFTVALIFVVFVAYYFSNSLVSPIKYITDSFKRLKSGDTDVKALPVPGTDEISQLAQWFNQFLDELRKRYESEEALRLSEERYELVSRATNEGIWDLNRKTKTVYFSDRFREIAGYKPGELTASMINFYRIIYPDDRPYIKRRFKEFLHSRKNFINVEHRIDRPDGTFVHVSNNCQAIRDKKGRVMRMAGSIQDVSMQKEIEGRLRHDASHDPLTGLYNRQWMLKRINRELVEYRAHPEKEFAVLFLDLDDFKQLNDTLGHSYGDLLLIEVSKRIEQCIRPGDSLGRLGGDEFIVLLPDIRTSDALQVVDRLVETISEPYLLYHHEYKSHASIGVAFAKTGYDNAEEILRDADTAMYRAKSMGKGRYEIFDNEMREILLQRTSMEKDLVKALEEKHLEMYFQPIYCLKTEKTIGFESLIRWNHPTKGVSPDIFIPLAEESNLIHPLGHWIFGQVVRQIKRWEEQFELPPDFKVAVNISPKQFTDPGLVEFMKQLVSQYQVDAGHIAVELTETAIFRDKFAVLDSLTQLKDGCISIHLDDFGTGYSSLSYLNSFPISAIKIDKSFVSKIDAGEREERLVNTLILMARELDIKVIAEGVERANQLDYLMQRGCDYAQGYYIDMPLKEGQATEILTSLYPLKKPAA
ncbi:MAG: EAL domain-containing protein [Candidatus Sedimenticola sp. 6PFRAG1]